MVNLPQLLSNQVIEDLRTKRNTLETDYQDKLQTFKPSYPAMMQISSQIAEIDQQIAARGADAEGLLQGGLRDRP